jgi:hypothetical protein
MSANDRIIPPRPVAAFVLLLLFVAACQQRDVEVLRRSYDADLVSFVLREEPQPLATVLADPAAVAEGAVPEPAPVPVTRHVDLDIRISHQGRDHLPGVTLDISQADAAQQEKTHWQVYVDTTGLVGEKQITHTLEDVDYVEGDGFWVEVRPAVPEGQRGAYREFSEASGS